MYPSNDFSWGRKLTNISANKFKDKYELTLRNKSENDPSTKEFFSRDLQSSMRTNYKKVEGKHRYRKLFEKYDQDEIIKSRGINSFWMRELDLSNRREYEHRNKNLRRQLQNSRKDEIGKIQLGQSSNRNHNRERKNKSLHRPRQSLGEYKIWIRELNQSNNRNNNHKNKNRRRQLQSTNKDELWNRELNQSSNRNHSYERKTKSLRRQLQMQHEDDIWKSDLGQSNKYEGKHLRRNLSEMKLDKEFWTQVYESN